MNKTQYPMGSVISGTMRPLDLLEAFTSVLHDLNPKRYEQFVLDNQDALGGEDYDDLVDELFDVLGEYAGPYFYFGSHQGDGADYGFWFSQDEFDTDVRYGEILKVNDLREVSFPLMEYYHYAAVISDHGNITLYNNHGDEVWSIV